MYLYLINVMSMKHHHLGTSSPLISALHQKTSLPSENNQECLISVQFKQKNDPD